MSIILQSSIETNKDILTKSKFLLEYSQEENILNLSREDISIHCNYNIISMSINGDGETYNILEKNFFEGMKMFPIDGGDILKFESNKRYMDIHIDHAENESSNIKIAKAIIFFLNIHMREIIKDEYDLQKQKRESEMATPIAMI